MIIQIGVVLPLCAQLQIVCMYMFITNIDKPDTVSPYMKQLMDETKLETKADTVNGAGSIDIQSELGQFATCICSTVDSLGIFTKSKYLLMKVITASLILFCLIKFA